MPNWCSNRMYFSGEPAQIAEIKRLASGAVTPLYRRATNEGIQLFLAGSAGLLQITENIRSEQCPGVTAAGRGAVSTENNGIDFILTDPPYLVGFRDRQGRTIAGDKTDEWLQPACNEMYRVLKKDALMVSFYGWNRVDRFMAAWKNAGFSVVGHLVFTKNYTSKAAYVGYRHECAYVLAKGRPALPQKPLPDVLGWKYSGNRHHPTEKPVTSLQPLIESFTHPNAIVLDPFAGSGSTCVAALQSGRRYIGIELLEQYHRAGQQRLAAVQRAMQQGAANDDWFMPEAA